MIGAIRFLHRIIDILLLPLFLFLFFIGAYTMYDTLLIYDSTESANLRTYKPAIVDGEIDWDMNALSENVVAWLTVDDTSIDYPIMQGEDNSEYLNKTPFGTYSIAGSIFLDSRNASDFSDEYSLVYGHHMEFGYMFGALDAFVKEDYFAEHRTGTLTIGNVVYKINFFAFLETDGATQEIFVPDSAKDALQYTKENALIWYEPDDGPLIALSTCKFPETTQRTIVFGVLIP